MAMPVSSPAAPADAAVLRIEAPAARIALGLLLALPVLVTNPWTSDPFTRPKMAAVQALIVAFLLTLVVIHPARRISIQVSTLSLPLVALVALALVSTFASVETAFSFLQTVHLGLLVAVFHVLASPRDAAGRVTSIFRVIAVVGGLVAAYGVLKLIDVDGRSFAGSLPGSSFLGTPELAAEFLVLAIPPTLALVAMARGRSTIVGWSVVALVQVLHLGTTRAWGALLGLAVGVLVAGVLFACSRTITHGRRDVGRWFLVAAILVVPYGVFILPLPGDRGHEPTTAVTDAAPSPPRTFMGLPLAEKSLVRPEGLGRRLPLWSGAVRLIGDHWLIGVGPGNVELVFPAAYIPTQYWWPVWRPEPFVHNDWLELTAELGLPGLALVLIVISLVAKLLWSAARGSRPHDRSLCLVASLGSLVAVGIAGVFGTVWHMPAHGLYAVVLLASLVALALDAPPRAVTMSRVSASLLGVVLATIVVLGAARLQLSEMHAHAVAAWLARGEQDEAVRARARASQWFPQRERHDRLWMRATSPGRQYRLAAERFRAELVARPDDPSVRFDLGRALARGGDFDEAARVFGDLLAVRPQAPDVLRWAIEVALARDRSEEAATLYERLAAVEGCDGQIALRLAVAYEEQRVPATASEFRKQAAECSADLAPRAERLPEPGSR